MKDAFKVGFGVTMGVYCASVIIYVIQHWSDSSKKTQEDSNGGGDSNGGQL